MRDYHVMRDVLKVAAGLEHEAGYDRFKGIRAGQAEIDSELMRLIDDKIVAGDVRFTADGACLAYKVSGLTDEGREFFKLVENDNVWEIVCKTLDAARVDVSYPLLKEVCEEIVKRYVTSFIPKELERGNTV